MGTQTSKLCADHLRALYKNLTGNKLKASHATELVAAFFGYKSHAALLSEKQYPIENIDEAYIIIPDVELIEVRRKRLAALPDDLPPSIDIAKGIATFLETERHTVADFWLYESLKDYCIDVLLVNCQELIDDQLAGAMAETNAVFCDHPWYEIQSINDHEDEMTIIAMGKHEGEQLDDKPFCGDTIEFTVQISLPRIAGKRGFYDFDLDTGGKINEDWVDQDLINDSQATYKFRERMAAELGISTDEADELYWEVHENASDDGLIYNYVIQFSDGNSPELLAKIKGLDNNHTIRVDANFFDDPPNPFDDM